MKQNSLATAIVLTIAYTDQFQFPLTAKEVWLRLVQASFPASGVTLQQVTKILSHLVSKKLLQKKNGYYFLLGQQQHIAERKKRATISAKKWLQVAQLTKIAKFVPWIEAIFVTGSLAMDSAIEDDDIDLLVVTRRRRLWISRLLVVLLSSFLGKRRAWNADVKGEAAVKDSWCFNLWLDQNHLKTQSEQRSIYLAYEILQAIPVFDRSGIHEQLLQENDWVKEYLPEWFFQKLKTAKTQPRVSFFSYLDALLEPVLVLLDWFMFKLQLIYMRPHMTTERVSSGFAFFHPRSTKTLFFQRWQYSLVQLLSRQARAQKEKVVLVTGVFDILHQEHVTFLRKARQQGQVLLIGIESDTRVTQMKGEGRPINTAQVRQQNLEALALADEVFVLPEQFSKPADHELLIAELKPDILAVSSHTAHLDKKQILLKKYGGQVMIVHQHNPVVSTTQLLSADRS